MFRNLFLLLAVSFCGNLFAQTTFDYPNQALNDPVVTIETKSNTSDGYIGLKIKDPTLNSSSSELNIGVTNYSNLPARPYINVGGEFGRPIDISSIVIPDDYATFYFRDTQPMIEAMGFKVWYDGRVYIGDESNPLSQTRIDGQYRLHVENGIRCEKIKVDLDANWGDFVFSPEYKILSLDSLDTFIKTNNHLPNIPAATEIESEGLDLGEMQRLQMIKIEELTLHMIEINKEKQKVEKQNSEIKEVLDKNNEEVEALKEEKAAQENEIQLLKEMMLELKAQNEELNKKVESITQ